MASVVRKQFNWGSVYFNSGKVAGWPKVYIYQGHKSLNKWTKIQMYQPLAVKEKDENGKDKEEAVESCEVTLEIDSGLGVVEGES